MRRRGLLVLTVSSRFFDRKAKILYLGRVVMAQHKATFTTDPTADTAADTDTGTDMLVRCYVGVMFTLGPTHTT